MRHACLRGGIFLELMCSGGNSNGVVPFTGADWGRQYVLSPHKLAMFEPVSTRLIKYPNAFRGG